MNALVGVRANTQGHLSAGPAQRKAVRTELESAARAFFLNKLKAAQAQHAEKSATAGNATKAAPSAAKANDTASNTSATREVDNALDKDTFLQLLVTQMQNQDPIDPVDNSQMIAQLAQFSALEQMTNLNDSFTALSGNIDQLNFIAGNSLIGKHIVGVDVEGKAVKGVVRTVHLDGSIVYLGVGDQLVSMVGVLSIGTPPAEAEK